ncbi:MAG: ATP-binding protein [Candidatus Krumholzibacteriia bacterium]
MTPYYRRDISSAVKDALADMPVVVLTGMRQTGKSTFLQKEPGLRRRRYISLDDFAQLAAAREDPDGFVATDEPVTIDEAQKCPEILGAIKRNVDRDRTPGRFLLSGSANFSMLRGISESLAGRAVYFVLHPFTRREMSGATRRRPFLKTFFDSPRIPPRLETSAPIKPDEILSGGMPSVCLGEVKNRALWFRGYEQTYLERDIRELSQIGDIISFRNLMGLAALRTGQLLSPSQLGRDAKLNAATTSRYLSLLEISYVAYRLSPYLRNRASRLIKTPKLYLGDAGLACHLAGVGTSGAVLPEPFKGGVFETYVAQNLMGILGARWPEARLHFWNVQGRHEVDFVIETGRSCIAIESKSGTRWTDRNLAGLNAFISATPHCKAAILAYNGTEAVSLGRKLWALPLGMVLS